MRAVVRIVAGLAVLGAVSTGGVAAFAATTDGASSGMAQGGAVVHPDATAVEYGVVQPDATAIEYGLVQPDATAIEYGVIQPDATAIEYGVIQPDATAVEYGL